MNKLIRRGIVSLLSLAFLAGCSTLLKVSLDQVVGESSIVDAPDTVDTIKQYPELLTDFLVGLTGVKGLERPRGVEKFTYRYDIKGKDDELIVLAKYALKPAEHGARKPVLTDYSLREVNENKTVNVTDFSLADGKRDLVNTINQNPRFLRDLLESSRSTGLFLSVGVDDFSFGYDFIGKNNELEIIAKYHYLTVEKDGKKADLIEYSIYDSNEGILTTYNQVDGNAPVSIIPIENPPQYNPGDKKI